MPYDRPPLSKQVLTRKVEPEAVKLHVEEGFDAEWFLDTTATGLELESRLLKLEGGGTIPFDRLVIATGAHPRVLRGTETKPGVHYLRTIDDSVALRDDMDRADKLVVIGAGFIGLEVAASAKQRGLDVTVLEALPVPLERAIGATMGAALAQWHLARAIDVRLSVGVDAIEGAERVEAVRLSDGSILAADIVVVGIGVAPTTEWLEGSGIDIADGVVCDGRMRVMAAGQPRDDIVAAGDVARWSHRAYGASIRIEHWTNAAEQAEAAARTLIHGDQAPEYVPTPYFWSDQHGVKIQFVGEARPGDEVAMIEGSVEEDRFVAVYGREGKLVAALGMRRPARVMAFQRLIAEGASFPPE